MWLNFKSILHGNRNNQVIAHNALAALIVKGLALSISFFSVPAYIHYFDNNVYLGLWYTILSIVIWVLNFDLGIGNGIRNSLVRSFASHDIIESKKIISSGIFASGLLSLILTIACLLILRIVNLHAIFNISEDAISHECIFYSSAFVLIAIMIRLYLSFVHSLFYAAQKSRYNNYLSLLVSIVQLLFVLLFHFENLETALLSLSFSFIFTSNLPVIIAGLIAFSTTFSDCKPSIKCVSQHTLRQIIKVGGMFFACQILYMLIMNTNEFFITHYYGAEYTVVYTFYFKITFLVSMLVSLAMTPMWSMITKALAEGQFQWLGKLYKCLKYLALVITLMQIILAICMQPIMDIWLGNAAIEVDMKTAFIFALFGSSFVYNTILSTIVCGLEMMKLQFWSYLIGVCCKIVLISTLSNVFTNWTLVVWSNIIIFFPYCILQQMILDRYFKKLLKYEGSSY